MINITSVTEIWLKRYRSEFSKQFEFFFFSFVDDGHEVKSVNGIF